MRFATAIYAASAASSAAAAATSVRRRSTTDPTQLSGKTFDFVVAGGGTAGLALAGRLAEWGNVTVAVIEAGSDGSDVAEQIAVPGMSYLNGLTGTANDWAYNTVAQTSANNATRYWPRGKVLGGSSAMNGGFWCRASEAEYNAWNTLHEGVSGAVDWGWETMQKYIKKSETFTPMSDEHASTFSVTHDSSAHGSDGPIQTSYSAYQFSQLSSWIPTMVNLGLPHLLDPANGTNAGVSFVPSIISPSNSSRSDSNAGYIVPHARTNLVILTGYQVTKINWNSTTSGSAVAGGVSFAASALGTVYTVNAAKEVILSGGVIGSPQILQLSGVGPKSLVTGLGIDSVVDLPGVGQNLQDHLSVSLYMQATTNDTWAALKDDKSLWDQQLAIWKANGTGMWTYWNEATAYPATTHLMGTSASSWASAIDTTTALATSVSASAMDATVEAGAKAQYTLLKEWASASNIGQVELIFNMLGSAAGMIGIQFCLQHPFSRGYININSASVFDYPTINPNYLSVSYDFDILRSALEYTRSIIATAPMTDIILGETGPGVATSADDAINAYIQSTAGTEYHPIGTCGMMPQAMGGVVNTSLVVYGTANVRVVDVSIAPMHISAHTMATAYGIAEHAADMIKATYGASTSSSDASDSGSSSSSSTNGGSSKSNSGSDSSSLSSTTKIAIAAAAAGGTALIALLALVCLCRRRNTKRKNAAAAVVAATAYHKEGAGSNSWYAEDVPMQPRAPFMAGVGKRHSAQPSEFSVDSTTTVAHPEPMQHAKHAYGYVDADIDAGSLGAASEGTYYEPQPHAHAPAGYGAVHTNLSTADVAALHAHGSGSASPAGSGHGSPYASPPGRYTDLPSPVAPLHYHHQEQQRPGYI
ncbi:Choline dehydrogenase [Mycena kentingensis (nom. inval.)]|nr:Choline dehydrogenase [Mycena kentingensis (nom. inval.)]